MIAMPNRPEIGIQLVTHMVNEYSVSNLVRLAQLAHDSGIDRAWIDDNLRFRNIFVIMSAIASRVPIGIGSAIMVPHFRNPIDTADALCAISELTRGRELCIGIARGSSGLVPYQLKTERPIRFIREYVVLLKSLLEGHEIAVSEFPLLASYFQFREDARFKMAFRKAAPITFYHGCVGAQASKLAGEAMDGILVSGLYVALLKTGRIHEVIDAAKKGLAKSQKKEFHFGCEINISLSDDERAALQGPKVYLAHVIPGSYDKRGLIEPLGIDRNKVEEMKARLAGGTSFEEIAGMISDEDVKKCFIAGTPRQCRDEIMEVVDKTVKLGFDRISFKPGPGPGYEETIKFIGQEVAASYH